MKANGICIACLSLVILGTLVACSTASDQADGWDHDFMDWQTLPPADQTSPDGLDTDLVPDGLVPDGVADSTPDLLPDLLPDMTQEEVDMGCIASCEGKECGDDGCGGSCGNCTAAQEACISNQCQCVPACDGLDCGDDGCGGVCGVCQDNEMCTVDQTCWCIPACTDMQCGDDGCGGVCGNCLGAQDACIAGHCICQPACAGKECGPDGCGDYCGLCNNPNALCLDGVCECYEDCTGKECGSDGCSGSCGTCLGPQDACVEGQCQCQPACTGSVCGNDGCGGVCGTCPFQDQFCSEGQCMTQCLHDCEDELFVASGIIWLGCNEPLDVLCDEPEKPYHATYLNGYYIDQTEVTVAAYAACVSAGSCALPDAGDAACNWGKVDRDAHPVNCVTWHQAQDYCAWAGKRLPTEAEWEKAARGTDGRLYPWGNQTPSCSYAVMYDGGFGCGFATTFPVCTKSLSGNSPFGGCDMAGNVWEWTADWYHANYYATSPSSNPMGPETGTTRVIRGGGFKAVAKYLRTSFRLEYSPSAFNTDLGFRCARTP